MMKLYLWMCEKWSNYSRSMHSLRLFHSFTLRNLLLFPQKYPHVRKAEVITKAKNYGGSYSRVRVHERKLASTGGYSIPLGASSRRPQYSFEVLKGFLCRISPLYISFSLNISYYVLDFMPYEKLPIRRPLWRLSLQTSRRILASLSWSNSVFLHSIFFCIFLSII